MSDNLPQVEAALLAYQERFDVRVGNAAREISLALEGYGKNEIRGRRPKGEKAITGEPPMNRTGNLRRSIRGTSVRIGFAKYEAIAGTDMIYGRAVEMGAPYNPPSWQNGERFPYLAPALKKFAMSGLVSTILTKHIGVK